MNIHDSDRMAGMLENLGYDASQNVQSADGILLNTCAVRERPEYERYSEWAQFVWSLNSRKICQVCPIEVK